MLGKYTSRKMGGVLLGNSFENSNFRNLTREFKNFKAPLQASFFIISSRPYLTRTYILFNLLNAPLNTPIYATNRLLKFANFSPISHRFFQVSPREFPPPPPEHHQFMRPNVMMCM